MKNPETLAETRVACQHEWKQGLIEHEYTCRLCMLPFTFTEYEVTRTSLALERGLVDELRAWASNRIEWLDRHEGTGDGVVVAAYTERRTLQAVLRILDGKSVEPVDGEP